MIAGVLQSHMGRSERDDTIPLNNDILHSLTVLYASEPEKTKDVLLIMSDQSPKLLGRKLMAVQDGDTANGTSGAKDVFALFDDAQQSEIIAAILRDAAPYDATEGRRLQITPPFDLTDLTDPKALAALADLFPNIFDLLGAIPDATGLYEIPVPSLKVLGAAILVADIFISVDEFVAEYIAANSRSALEEALQKPYELSQTYPDAGAASLDYMTTYDGSEEIIREINDAPDDAARQVALEETTKFLLGMWNDPADIVMTGVMFEFIMWAWSRAWWTPWMISRAQGNVEWANFFASNAWFGNLPLMLGWFFGLLTISIGLRRYFGEYWLLCGSLIIVVTYALLTMSLYVIIRQ